MFILLTCCNANFDKVIVLRELLDVGRIVWKSMFTINNIE